MKTISFYNKYEFTLDGNIWPSLYIIYKSKLSDILDTIKIDEGAVEKFIRPIIMCAQARLGFLMHLFASYLPVGENVAEVDLYDKVQVSQHRRWSSNNTLGY